MDPGTAIGLAGTVYKVVIAGIEFVGDAKQVYAKGGTDDNRDLDAVAQDIQSASASLEEQLDRTKPLGGSSYGKSQHTAEEEVSLHVFESHIHATSCYCLLGIIDI